MPATADLFTISDSPLLPRDRSDTFHSCVARLLYLAKRIWPDMLTAISFLSSLVQAPTEADEKKLTRLLKYLNATADCPIVLSFDPSAQVIAYIDASYAVHGDFRSHSGVYITIGSGSIFCRSSKQKLNTKSSTEAELVALSDGLTQVLWTRNYLLAQGFACPPAVVYQDNMSTMELAIKGRPCSGCTRHIHTRYFWIHDRIASLEVIVEYCPTEILADILIKPLVEFCSPNSSAKF
jgi:hypothetical protein